jgi:hypothetical protein
MWHEVESVADDVVTFSEMIADASREIITIARRA